METQNRQETVIYLWNKAFSDYIIDLHAHRLFCAETLLQISLSNLNLKAEPGKVTANNL